VLDFSVWELMVIGAVALVVIGPEKLPRVARTAGHLLGRFQRYVADVKADINREIELSELKKLQGSVEDAARSIEHSVKSGMEEAEKHFKDAENEMRAAGAEIEKAGEELKQSLTDIPMPHMGTAISEPTHSIASPQESSAPRAKEEEDTAQMELSLESKVEPTAAKQG
jgi:sec-independent protein translocase protein TatB